MAVRPLQYLSLCTGIGGLDRGVHRAARGRARALAYVEREGFAVQCLVEAMGQGRLDDAPVHGDVHGFPGWLFAGRVDLVVAGYPCQPFSVAGKRAGVEDERHLWPAVARIVAESGPALVFLENVPGHVSLGLDAVQRDLEGLGYRCAGLLLRASDVGAPHRRERLFVLAARLADGLHERLAILCEGEHDDGPGVEPHGHDADRRDPLVAYPDDAPGRAEPREQRGERAGIARSDGGAVGHAARGDGPAGWSAERGAPEHTGSALPGEGVEHAVRGGRDEGSERQPAERWTVASHGARDRGASVADADGRREGAERAELDARRLGGAWPGSSALGDTGRLGEREPHGHGAAELRGGPWAAPERAGGPLPDPDGGGVRLEPERDQRAGWSERAPERGHAEPLHDGAARFPPLPGDLDGWAEYLRVRPEAVPAAAQCGLRGCSDGLPERLVRHRVDQLRAYGNAVVAEQAAVALRILASEMLACLEG